MLLERLTVNGPHYTPGWPREFDIECLSALLENYVATSHCTSFRC